MLCLWFTKLWSYNLIWLSCLYFLFLYFIYHFCVTSINANKTYISKSQIVFHDLIFNECMIFQWGNCRLNIADWTYTLTFTSSSSLTGSQISYLRMHMLSTPYSTSLLYFLHRIYNFWENHKIYLCILFIVCVLPLQYTPHKGRTGILTMFSMSVVPVHRTMPDMLVGL